MIDFFILACEIITILFVVYYTLEEYFEMRHMGWAYMGCFWSYVDVLILCLAVISISFNAYRFQIVHQQIRTLVENNDAHSNFETLAGWQFNFNVLVALTIFFCWIKLFKYLNFNTTMSQLSDTLFRCTKDIAGFSVMFFIIFFSYAQLGYLLFGSLIKPFHTFPDSTFTLFRIILGDFDFEELQKANRVLGPLYFITYVFFVFFILLNVFLAIINDSYIHVKDQKRSNRDQEEVFSFLKTKWDQFASKLKKKEKNLATLKQTLHDADRNHDGLISEEELMNEGKGRGLDGRALKSMLAKYDKNGDRVLDEEEQSALNKEIEVKTKKLEEQQEKMRSAEPTMSSFDGAHASSAETQMLKNKVQQLEGALGTVLNKVDLLLLRLETLEHRKKLSKANKSNKSKDYRECQSSTTQQDLNSTTNSHSTRNRHLLFGGRTLTEEDPNISSPPLRKKSGRHETSAKKSNIADSSPLHAPVQAFPSSPVRISPMALPPQLPPLSHTLPRHHIVTVSPSPSSPSPNKWFQDLSKDHESNL